MDTTRDIFKETNCLNGQQLKDYLQGRLGKEEMHEVETHLSSCAFCSEALEGLSKMEQPEELPAIVQQIRSRFKHRLRTHYSRNRKMKKYLWLTVIVFIIIAILLLAYYTINDTMKGSHPHPLPPAGQQEETLHDF